MPTARHLQSTFSAGEFDPLLQSREDVAFFYNSARIIENGIPLPQGGVKRREGWGFAGLQRGALVARDLSAGASVTVASAYGTAGYETRVIDGDPATVHLTTVDIGSVGTDYVVLAVTLPVAEQFTAFDIRGLRFTDLPAAVSSADVLLQTSLDGVAWTTVLTCPTTELKASWRYSAAPDSKFSARQYFRIVILSAVAATLSTARIEIADVAVLNEAGWSSPSAVPGNFNAFRVTPSIVSEYALILTAGNMDVFRFTDGQYVGSAVIPHTDAQVSAVKASASLDSIILYQVDQPPQLVQRVSGDGVWSSKDLPFDSVARIEFESGTVSGGKNELQVITPTGVAAGDTLVFEYNGESSAQVTWNATAATNATNMETALNGMDAFSGVKVTIYSGGPGYRIEFGVPDNKRTWPIMVVNILKGSGTITIDRLQYGKPDTDDLWSATRGYPACGCFYQGRHWMGGFRSRPDVLAGSRAGSYFDFKGDADPVAGSPIVVAPNVDDQIEILALFPGRHLQIFTSSTEFYVPDEPITVDNIALKATSRFGSSPDVRPVDVQGGTLFVDRNGRALREYLYTDTEASYSAEPISIMGGHLVADARFLCLRRAQDVDRPAMLLMANYGVDRFGDKVPAAMCVIDRAQQVTGFVRVKTPGTVLGFTSSQQGGAFAVVRRELAGQPWNYIEFFDPAHLSDSSVFVENPDVEEFVATDGQTAFVYLFTSPADPQDVSVWVYDGKLWQRQGADDYTVNLGTNTVTFALGRDLGAQVRIVKRRSMIDVSAAPHLEGIECFVHGDGLPIGSFTPSSAEIDIGDQRYDFMAEVGLRMVPRVVMQPYKGKGEMSPTMQNQRIFRALLQLERTGAISLGINGQRLRPVPLQRHDSGVMDLTLEEVLFTGQKRIEGMSNWLIEPCLEFSQDEPMPFLLRSITYDVRF